MGVETEYGLAGKLSPEETARYLFRPVMEKYRSTNVFTHNGSRLYLDVGAHPEIATAECDDVHQLLVYDRAGDAVLNDLAVRAEKSLTDDHIGGQIFLFKNNVDSMGNSYGCHENYLVGREMSLKILGKQLLPFMVTRQLIAGAGRLDGGEFLISQRADHMWEGISSATTRSRPIINTRDEPHGDSEKYRRMHVIVGDSNMSEPTFQLKIASTLAMLELIEGGHELPNLELARPIEQIREVARDPHARLELKQGGTMTALEMQRLFLEAARATCRDEYALDLWERTLDAIEQDDYSDVDTEIDWVIKRKLLSGFAQRSSWEDPKLAQIDLAYHDIRPGRGLFGVLEKRGAAKRLTTDEEIALAVDNAPETTRARLRGQALKRAEAAGVPITVDWVRIKANNTTVELLDPFATVDERVDSLL